MQHANTVRQRVARTVVLARCHAVRRQRARSLHRCRGSSVCISCGVLGQSFLSENVPLQVHRVQVRHFWFSSPNRVVLYRTFDHFKCVCISQRPTLPKRRDRIRGCADNSGDARAHTGRQRCVTNIGRHFVFVVTAKRTQTPTRTHTHTSAVENNIYIYSVSFRSYSAAQTGCLLRPPLPQPSSRSAFWWPPADRHIAARSPVQVRM